MNPASTSPFAAAASAIAAAPSSDTTDVAEFIVDKLLQRVQAFPAAPFLLMAVHRDIPGDLTALTINFPVDGARVIAMLQYARRWLSDPTRALAVTSPCPEDARLRFIAGGLSDLPEGGDRDAYARVIVAFHEWRTAPPRPAVAPST